MLHDVLNYPVFALIGYTLIVGLVTSLITALVTGLGKKRTNLEADYLHEQMASQKPGWQKEMINEIVQRVKSEKCFAHEFIDKRLREGDSKFDGLQAATKEMDLKLETFMAVAHDRYEHSKEYFESICKELTELKKFVYNRGGSV